SSNTTSTEKVADSASIDINNYVFQSDFPRKKNKKEKEKPVLQKPNADSINLADPLTPNADETPIGIIALGPVEDSASYLLPKQRNYELSFMPSYVLTQLDNNLLNETYQAYTGGAVYFYPGLNLE
ncbi:MAG: hypothetical protein ABL927_14965, partial [Bdellovibrionales bacterium]